jgi:hypothetical protein
MNVFRQLPCVVIAYRCYYGLQQLGCGEKYIRSICWRKLETTREDIRELVYGRE